jgi:DNA-binding transcriptional LysR family regulator
MNDRLSALKIFVRIARTGSFSRAAKDLGLSQPSASRLITALEREVGAPLLIRNTRAVSLTDAGVDYLARIEPALVMLDDAGQAARGAKHLRGVLRIGLPATIAIRGIMPHLPSFLAQHPSLRVDFVMEDNRQDMVIDSIDVALRFGELESSQEPAQLVGRDERVLVASPGYLKKAGTPQSPHDLANHRLIIGPPAAMKDAWTFQRRREVVNVRASGHFIVNVNYAAHAAAVAGLGVLSTGYWGCAHELRAGNLVRLLPEWQMGAANVYAVFAPGPSVKPAARAFIRFIKKYLQTRDAGSAPSGRPHRSSRHK